ncbi:UV DNA damage repair endonuclease UvsE [Clostridium sporogenes]|uniref:UV damage endonuclease n=1 Tax=Clostridium cochlearium TaxID=1494 RepID=A0A2X2WAP5_CLOCO|nr:UV DNA damage repair endonuclease UvsE [Clostridium cochlearium]MBE6064495.1 UV DNA damage repair endonuclease UvsE [Clostridium cochlearium]MBU5269527.1 UV DNA damage repair endonuclease UvsE [Clostridium cochlearium]SQB33105.1 UV damage endonuclease [Clostridium cochlearium]
MNIGYACLTIGVPDTNYKNCMLKNANEEKLLELIAYNLNSLENVIDYNIKNNIKLFRISSDIIPFGSNPINNIKWWKVFSYKLSNIGEKIKNSGMRVSMHPGQYTVLNSPKEEVVKKAIEDLNYHAKFLESLNMGIDGKIVLHIGGVYNDKNEAIKRFIKNYSRLDDLVKQRLVIENDDKSYNIKDVLEIAQIINIPVVFDNLHNQVNPYNKNESDYYWINKCKKTWKKEDGYQKIHYSQQDPLKKPGSHSQTIYINEFINFYKNLQRNDIDIMLEVKDKNLSAIKCINCTSDSKFIKELENEWGRYKYKILENSPLDYIEIRKLLKNKNSYPAMEFYNLIENGLQKESNVGNSINAASHVWGYFKDIATEKEKNNFLNNIERYRQGKTSIKTVKNILWKMTVKYNREYLLNSYYFL